MLKQELRPELKEYKKKLVRLENVSTTSILMNSRLSPNQAKSKKSSFGKQGMELKTFCALKMLERNFSKVFWEWTALPCNYIKYHGHLMMVWSYIMLNMASMTQRRLKKSTRVLYV